MAAESRIGGLHFASLGQQGGELCCIRLVGVEENQSNLWWFLGVGGCFACFFPRISGGS